MSIDLIIIAALAMSFIPQEKPYTSPLIAACDDKFVLVTQLLINHGADINYQDGVRNYCILFS